MKKDPVYKNSLSFFDLYLSIKYKIDSFTSLLISISVLHKKIHKSLY